MRWLAYWFGSDQTRSKLSDLASGTSGSMKNISKPSVLGMKILLPPIDEQYAIVSALDVADKSCSTLGFKINVLKQEKKALMQQLLTGKRRVKTDEAPA
jgi:type I restriction enzyme S subunit